MSEEQNIQEENTQAVEEVKTFTEEEVASLISAKVDEAVQGLKNKNDELLGKLKKEKEAAKEQELTQNGSLEELKEFYAAKEKELEAAFNDRAASIENEYKEKLSGLSDAVRQRDKADIINQLVGDFVDSTVANSMLKQMIDVEDGNQVYRDFGGNVVADNLDDFKKWMNGNESMSHLLKGTRATGGGARGSSGKAAAGKFDGLSSKELLSAGFKQ